MSYQHPSTSLDEDEETAVPFVPTLTPATLTTVDQRSKVVAVVVAGILLLVMVAGGGAVVLFETPNGGRTTTDNIEISAIW